MTLIIETPCSRAPERAYILQVLLGDFLGLEWRHQATERLDTRITLTNSTEEIRLPDTLLSVSDEQWLTSQSMPERPLFVWDTREFAADIALVDPRLPVIYGNTTQAGPQKDSIITLPIDIFGSAFFMLTRYEEMVTTDRDEHERFPAWASVAYQESFLHRPIVDEYVEVLWEALRRTFPRLQRAKARPQSRVTCDVDNPFCFDGSLRTLVRRAGGDVLKRHSARMAVRTLIGSWQARRGMHCLDPHRLGIKTIMDINEEANRAVTFYLITEKTDPKRDKPVSLDNPHMREMIREISHRGHEVGVHPGYNTYQHPDAMARSVATLRRVLSEESIHQESIGARQHFLRWSTPTTPRLMEQNGLNHDSTLGYADRPGFRCGTSREYQLYDLEKRHALYLKERPLIVMECSVIAKRYLALGYSNEALTLMESYKEKCNQFNGNFTLLWHNSHLDTAADKHFYQCLTR